MIALEARSETKTALRAYPRPSQSEPPVIVVADEPKPLLIYDQIWTESKPVRSKLIKDIRKRCDQGALGAVQRARVSIEIYRRAERDLRKHCATLADNQRVMYPAVRIQWAGVNVYEPTTYDGINYHFDKWIAEQRSNGNHTNVEFLKQQQKRAHESLARTTRAVLETQKVNGLWSRRIREFAARATKNHCVTVASQQRPTSLGECTTLIALLDDLARMTVFLQDHEDIALNERVVRSITRRVLPFLGAASVRSR